MSTKTNLVLDLGMFGAMLAVTNPHLTGNTIHEWLGVSLVGALITHLLLHWDWIIKVGKEFFRKFLHQSRLNFVVDTLFFIAMTGSIFSGILISKNVLATLGIQLDVNRSWKMIHTLTSDASLIVLGIHFALHWKWVVNSIGRYVVTPIRNVFRRRPAAQPLIAQSLQAEKN
jgi:uncharacterized membrane protein